MFKTTQVSDFGQIHTHTSEAHFQAAFTIPFSAEESKSHVQDNLSSCRYQLMRLCAHSYLNIIYEESVQQPDNDTSCSGHKRGILDLSRNMVGNKERRKRGRYSRSGCFQCKSRRVKCDEQKPQCWQCLRLLKSCLYPEIATHETGTDKQSTRKKSRRNIVGEKRLTESGWVNQVDARRQNGEITETFFEESNVDLNPSKIRHPNSVGPPKQSTSHVDGIVIFDTHSDPKTKSYADPTSIANLVLPDEDSLEAIGERNLSSLVSDLNKIVNDMMVGGHNASSATIENAQANEFTETYRNGEPMNHENEDYLPKNIPFEYIKVCKNQESIYLEEFYNNFATIIQPFHSYDEKIGYFCPARDILLETASRESFLLSAILAQGAKMSFKKHHLQEDEEASYKYLVTCSKLLEPALIKARQDKSLVNSKIEAVLLTILFLVSSNASILNLDWRSHLRGAKELLLSYPTSDSEQSILKSKIMVFCKQWFISFEILAGLSSRRGGTLGTLKELSLILTTDSDQEIEILREIGIIRPDGFNLLIGMHYTCLTPIRGLIKIIKQTRERERETLPDTFEVIDLLSQLNKQLGFEFTDRRCIIKSDSFEHNKPAGCLLGEVTIRDEKLVISWMDICHQAYVFASIVILLRKGLQFPSNATHVQTVNRKLLELISFLGHYQELSNHTKSSMILLQWPIFVAGINCLEDKEKLLVMKFFRNSADIGTSNSTYALRKLNKLWHRATDGDENDYLDSGSDVDVFAY